MSTEVNLARVLAFREQVAQRKNVLHEKYNLPVISFTMNIAGAVKRTLLSDFAFRCGVAELEKRLGKAVFYETVEEEAGCRGFFVYDCNAKRLKAICMEIEDSAVGRLYDLDVLDEHGNTLHRGALRKCLICEHPAAECGRSKAHSIEEISRKTEKILLDFVSERLAQVANSALMTELELTPKPGLVDKSNCGAHSDMCYVDFERSANALLPFFEKAVLKGFGSVDFSELEALGIETEKAMFEATNGINTHKGAIFIFMLLLYSFGKYFATGEDIFSTVSALAKQKSKTKETHGSKMNEKYGGGIIEEAKSGFPTAKSGAEVLKNGGSYLRSFFRIMSLCNDTNLLWRGGENALCFAKERAKNALSLNEAELEKEAVLLDEEFIKRNISPGGCADLFSASVFLTELSEIIPFYY